MAEFTPLALFARIEGSNTIWTSGNKVPIIDGKIKFFDKVLGCYFEIAVAQVKGQGSSAADKLSVVSDKHKNIINALLKTNDDEFTGDQIISKTKFDVISNAGAGTHPYFKEQHYRGTMSELLRKKIFSLDVSVAPPLYKFHRYLAIETLRHGKFFE